MVSCNRYPYPLFEILDMKGRIALFTVSAFLMALNTITLKWLYGRINGLGSSEYPQARPGHVKEPDFHNWGKKHGRHNLIQGHAKRLSLFLTVTRVLSTYSACVFRITPRSSPKSYRYFDQHVHNEINAEMKRLELEIKYITYTKAMPLILRLELTNQYNSLKIT